MRRLRFVSLSLLLLSLQVPLARAQKLDVELFRPNFDGRGLFGIDSATGHEPWDWSLGLFLHYARSQLRLQDTTNRLAFQVSDRLTANVVAAVGVTRWLELGFNLPYSPVNLMKSAAEGDTNQAGLGAMWLSPKFTLLREKEHGVSLAILAALGVPSGRDNSFLSQNGVQFQPAVVLEKGAGPLRFLLHVGATLRNEAQYLGTTVGHALDLRFGLGWRAHEKVELGAEILATTQFSSPFGSSSAGNAAEVLLGARFFPRSELSVWVGAGPGLTEAVGSPSVRIFGGLICSPAGELDSDGDGVPDRLDRCPKEKGPASNQGCPVKEEPKKAPPKDSDGDGLTDDLDRCPNEAGPKENQGCPWPDRDGDGVPDKDDKCPDAAGPASNQGCPVVAVEPDSDGDGVPDGKDRCPKVAGPKENQGCPWPDQDKDGIPDKDDKCPVDPGPKENNGCPWPDSDGDGVPDKDDDCPNQKGPASNRGCPVKGVVVTKGEVRITEQVNFSPGKATILKGSYRILDQVAAVLKQFPSLEKVEIQGHTDDQGRKASNQKLSQKRAAAVRTYLMKKGVKGQRLVAKGYGASKPLVAVSDDTGDAELRAARAKNRRVQFIIQKRGDEKLDSAPPAEKANDDQPTSEE